MVKEFLDKKFPFSGSNLVVFYIFQLCCISVLYPGSFKVFQSDMQSNFWFGIFAFIFINTWLISVVASFFTKRFVIRALKDNNESLILRLYLGRETWFAYSDLKAVEKVKKSFAYRYLSMFASKEPSYDLILNNGKRYRISPFMERQEELISKLQSIIADSHKVLDEK